MARRRTIVLSILGVVAALVVLAIAGLYVVAGTDWGHERVRRIALSEMKGFTHGIVRIGKIDGNLMNGATITGVSVTDSTGAPFLTADSVVTSYAIGDLISKRIYLHDVRVVNAVVVLDRKNGEKWNWDRIFPRDTTHPGGPPGLGSWVTLRNVTAVNAHITSRSPWNPPDSLKGYKRDSVIAFNLGPQGRVNIVRVGDGFQKISDFRNVFGTFPLLRLEDPGDARQIIDVSALRMVAEPLKPPSVRVTNVLGRFIVLGDSLYFRGVQAALAGSRLNGGGRYDIANDDLRLRLHADTIATNDLLWIDPNIPQDGAGKLDFALDWIGQVSDYQARNASLAVAGATMSGDLGLQVTDTFTFHDTDLRFAKLDTRTIQQLFPTIKSPRRGLLTGRMKAAGGFGALRLDGDVAFDDPQTGRTRIVANGIVGASGGVVRARDLKLNLEPLQVSLARAVSPSVPIGGTVTGTATVNGTSATRLDIRADLTHRDVTGPSHVTGTAAYARSGGRIPFVNADLNLDPLSLATVGRFAPAAGLHGSIAGPVKLTGPMSNLALDMTLTTPDGGSLAAVGTLDLASKEIAYDITSHALLFDASQLSTKAPSTSVSADVTARGAGTNPETLTSVATAHLRSSAYDSIAVDSAIARVSVAAGMVTIDTLVVDVPHGHADANGSIGLTAPHSGTLRYAARVDSLSALSRLLPPPDTGLVVPRPGILSARVSRQRADSARIARATEVERAVTGAGLQRIPIDTPRAIPRSTLSGSLETQGSLTGSIHSFDATGTASGRRIVAFGSSIGAFNGKYTWKNALTTQSNVSGQITATNLVAAGFSLDTVTATTQYQKPNGSVNVTVRQDVHRTYSVDAGFLVNKTQSQLLLNNVKLTFDSVTYASAHPSTIHFGEAGTDIDSLDLRTAAGRRVFVDGRVPTTGAANLHVDVTQFDVGSISGLLESDLPVQGLVSVNARLLGTSAAPEVHGAFGLERFSYLGHATPEVHGRLDYANETLTARVGASREGRAPLLTARGTIPINLALTGVTGSRIPHDRTIDATIDADSLPLDLLPALPSIATNVSGSALAKFTVGGTIDSPNVNGHLALTNGSAHLVPLGITLKSIASNIRIARDTVIVDSLVARSDGTVRLAGGIGLKNLAEPSFALTLKAAKARVMDNAMANLVVDANILAQGPFNNVAVTGTARALNGVIFIPESNGKTLIGTGDPELFNVVDTSATTQRELFPTQSPLLGNLRMNVAIGIDHDVFVRSRDANVEIYSDDDLRVSMDNAKQSLLLDGVILSDRGEYRFQARRFQIKRGSATFVNTPGLNPNLQVTAEYDVQLPTREAIAIQIIISGTLDKPKISLTSDAQPPISQTDLLSYLAFGQTSSSLLQQGNGLTTGGSGSGNIVGQSAAFAARQVGAAALGSFTDQIAGSAGRALGADVFDIEPADVSLDANSFLRGTQIDFGKYIQTRTYLQLQVRPDPASLQRPGFTITQRLTRDGGLRLEMSLEPRYLLTQPTLATDQPPTTTSAFGLFLIREWRY